MHLFVRLLMINVDFLRWRQVLPLPYPLQTSLYIYSEKYLQVAVRF